MEEACEHPYLLSKCICKLSSHLRSINHRHFCYVGFSSSPFPAEFISLPFLSLDHSCQVAVPPAAVAQDLLHASCPMSAQGSSWSLWMLHPQRKKRSAVELAFQPGFMVLWCCGADLAGIYHFERSKKLHVIIISHSLSALLSLLLGKAFSSACFPHADRCSFLFIYLFLPEICHTWKAKLASESRTWFAKTESSLPFIKKTGLLLVVHIYWVTWTGDCGIYWVLARSMNARWYRLQ